MARINATSALVDNCELVTFSSDEDRDIYGGQTEPVETSTSYPCRAVLMGGREATDVARVFENSEYKFTLPYGVAVERSGAIRWNGRTYPITGISEGTLAISTIVYTGGP